MKDICHLGAGWAGLCILAVDGWMWSGVRLAGLASSASKSSIRSKSEGS